MEESTFNRLRRIPLDELIGRLREVRSTALPPCPFSGAQHSAKSKLNIDVSTFTKRVQVIEESGWTVEELDRELERQHILDWVDEFNQNITIPAEVLDSARRHFPNVKFIPARIELE